MKYGYPSAAAAVDVRRTGGWSGGAYVQMVNPRKITYFKRTLGHSIFSQIARHIDLDLVERSLIMNVILI